MVEIVEPYGFIYITTNIINGKRYLGQKKFDNKWEDYLGSGKAFKDAVKKYGKENFKRNIIHVCYSPEELNQAEYDLSVYLDVVSSDNWYNLCYGGGSMSGYHHTAKTREKLSEAGKGRHLSDEAKKKLSESRKGENNPMYGIHLFGEKNGMWGKKGYNAKNVYCVELDRIFESTCEAAIITGIDQGRISKCCNNKYGCKTAGGYHWAWYTEKVIAC